MTIFEAITFPSPPVFMLQTAVVFVVTVVKITLATLLLCLYFHKIYFSRIKFDCQQFQRRHDGEARVGHRGVSYKIGQL